MLVVVWVSKVIDLRRGLSILLALSALSLGASTAVAGDDAGPPLSRVGRADLLDQDGHLNLRKLDWLLWKFDRGEERTDWQALVAWLARRQAEMTASMHQRLTAIEADRDLSKLPVMCFDDLLCTQLAAAAAAVKKFDDAIRMRAAIAEAEPVFRGYALAVDITRYMDPVKVTDASTVAQKIIARSFEDQMFLKKRSLGKPLSPDGRIILNVLLDAAAKATAFDNAAFMDGVVAQSGWPRISSHGDTATLHAWLIVQHADHVPDFQFRVLRLMEPLVEEDEVGRSHYAYLYDRVNVNLGLPQRYGSQFHCVDGRLALQPLEQPDKINMLRKGMGMGPIEQYSISPDEKCDS